MSEVARYTLPDEPRPSAFAGNVTNPMWPLLAFMLIGAWFGLAWFAFNSLALGSPTWRREALLMILIVVGSLALFLVLGYAMHAHWLDKQSLRYAALSIVCLRLGCVYSIHLMQSRVFELHSYFGGAVRNGAAVLVGAMVLLRPVVIPLLGNGLLGAVLK